jgi:erythromycin esterase
VGTPIAGQWDDIGWLRNNAIPIRCVDPGSGFDDLQALKPLFEGAKIVGLGESAHGVREFYTLKHRLIEFLVVELGFTALALEASFAGCQPINDYVRHGIGDRAVVLTGQHYMAWDTEEFAALLDWLRDHNKDVPDDRKVAFYGLDTGFNSVGRQAVGEFLARVAPDRLTSAEATFAVLRDLESKWPFRLDDTDATSISGCHERLGELLDYLSDVSGRLAASSSPTEVDRIREFVRVMRQWTEPGFARSRHMGENLVQIVQRERPDAKFIVWQANAHVGRRMLFHDETSLGDVAQDTYGGAYRPFALEFGEGCFLTRTLTASNEPSELVETVMTSPPEGSLPWYLSQVGADVFALDARGSTTGTGHEQWLTMELPEHGCMWYYTDPSTLYHAAKVAQHYDGLFFVQHITAARPTDQAMRGAALGERF